jgi:HD-GYP domain-containing protein (c-di-GMP phosphodiesterase class II)
LFAVADALGAITSDRPYRRARRWVDAGRELIQQSGKQFDPEVVRGFVASEGRLRAVRDTLEFSLASR